MYKVNVDLDNTNIVIEADNVFPFMEMEGFAKTSNGCTIGYNKNNALLIRGFLAGKQFSLDVESKTLLKYIADEEINEDIAWSQKLFDLTSQKVTKKFGSIKTEWDLIHYLPLRYIDKSNPQKVEELEVGQWAVIVGTIVNEPKYDYARNIVKIVIEDTAKKRISATFFRQKWLAFQYKLGDEVIMYGNYSEYVNHKGGRFPQLTNAKIDKLNSAHGELPMIPIYPQKSGDKSWQLQKAIEELLKKTVWFEDPVPEGILKKYDLMSRNDAYRKIHFPSNREEAEKARERIAFDDFIRLQVVLHNKREAVNSHPSAEKDNINLAEQYVSALPYDLTGGQKEVIEDIRKDMRSSHPMVRLIQGDVGSGKTTVATFALLISAGSGFQTALLAPTDILASQLYETITSGILEAGIDLHIELLTGKTTAKNKALILHKLANGELDAVVGTHTLIQDNVKFDNLGLLIVDEQHKFGAEQRSKLRVPDDNGVLPDVIVMSATPIPRTTAQVIYGDMDISIISELPQGRLPIETQWLTEPREAWDAVKEQLKLGHQAYIITAMVEETESMENVANAEEVYQQAKKIFSEYNVGLVHGRLGKKDKEQAMHDFATNNTQVLVSTTVVEVGVNVPNSTIIVILNANRFGISSLHQMRGRVGRSTYQSYCYLVGNATTPEAEERLNALVASNDGFYLAEKDLEIRGEGKLFGSEQSGGNELFIANLREHKPILDIAKRVAKGAASSKELQLEISKLYESKGILA